MQLRFRRAAVLLALAAMALRALLPMGWMPNPSGFAQSPLTICLMDLPMPMHMDMQGGRHGGHSGDHGQQQSNETCPFAAAPHLAGPALDIVVLEPQLALAAALSHTRGHGEIVALHYSPQSPRAPPSFA
jgi:hypothetical protein